MNYYAYLHAMRSVQTEDGLFRESDVRRVSKGSKGGGRFAEKPETKAKKDAADLLDKGETGESHNSFMDTWHGKSKDDRIYAVSDIHSSGIEGITDKDCGTIVLAGDFMDKGKKKEDIKDAEKWWKENFLPWCEDHKDQQIVIIGGNCDKWLYYNRDKVEWPKNVHYLDDTAADVNGMKVYGTSWCPHNMNGAWEVSEEEMEKEFSKIPYGLDVLVTHAPPKGEGLDLDKDDVNKGHFGSEALLKAILEKKPKIVLCGHVHRGSHKPVKIGDSLVMNVSRVDGDRYEQGFHGRRIGVERTDNGLGFLVDLDYDGKVPIGKKEDVPEEIIKMRDALRRAAKAIQRGISKGKEPDKEKIEKAREAIERANDAMQKFDHPRRKMLEDSIKAFHKSEEKGFKTPMPRVGRLWDGDENGKYEYFEGVWPAENMQVQGSHGGYGGWHGGQGGGRGGGSYVPTLPPWWATPAYGSSASKPHVSYGEHGGGYFGGHYSEQKHEENSNGSSHGQEKKSGMSKADIMAGKGMTPNYWAGFAKKK